MSLAGEEHYPHLETLSGVLGESSNPDDPPCLLCGSSIPELGAEVARLVGVPLLARRIERFPDGEMYVQLAESVRGESLRAVVAARYPAPRECRALDGRDPILWLCPPGAQVLGP